MVSTACSYGDASCLATARQQYSVISTDPASYRWSQFQTFYFSWLLMLRWL